jgi:DNA-binding LytR/AlgR family response regulator
MSDTIVKSTLRCLIVDDEPLARQLLQSHVDKITSLELIGLCETAMEAFEILHNQPIDLLFLDIQMPNITGLSFLKSLKNPPRVIFTTAYTEYAVEAFELDAIDYLLKPITFERFLKAVQKVTPMPANIPAAGKTPADTAIFLKVNKRLLRIEVQTILYIEGFGDYVKVILKDQTHVTYLSLTRMEELLPAEDFMRVHKSFIVNLRQMQFLEGNNIRVHGIDIPVSTSYRDLLYKRLGQE